MQCAKAAIKLWVIQWIKWCKTWEAFSSHASMSPCTNSSWIMHRYLSRFQWYRCLANSSLWMFPNQFILQYLAIRHSGSGPIHKHKKIDSIAGTFVREWDVFIIILVFICVYIESRAVLNNQIVHYGVYFANALLSIKCRWHFRLSVTRFTDTKIVYKWKMVWCNMII